MSVSVILKVIGIMDNYNNKMAYKFFNKLSINERYKIYNNVRIGSATKVNKELDELEVLGKKNQEIPFLVKIYRNYFS